MDFETVKELVGYAASLIILVSLLMTNVFRLRLINLVGSILFGMRTTSSTRFFFRKNSRSGSVETINRSQNCRVRLRRAVMSLGMVF